MDSEGLWADVRRVVLRGDVFGLAIAVLVGTALFQLLYSTIEYVIIPFASGVMHERGNGGRFSNYSLFSYFRGYTLRWGEVVSLGATLVLAILLVLLLKRWLFADVHEEGDEGAAEFEEQGTFRSCPECLSEIPSADRRCAYCTAPLEPPIALEGNG